MKVPRPLARAIGAVLLLPTAVSPAARALGPLSPAKLTVTRDAARLNELEGTIDYPVTFTNRTAHKIRGPIHVPAPDGLKNITTYGGSAGNHFVTLPVEEIRPRQSFTQVFRMQAPRDVESPEFVPMVETVPPLDPATAPAPMFVGGWQDEYIVRSDWPRRIRAVAGQEYLRDVDATNPNGGTLAFELTPIPTPTPDLAGAPFPEGATITPVTGIFRWTPPAPGLYAARLTVSDGKANAKTIHELAFQVEPADPPAVICNDFFTTVPTPGAETAIHYTIFRDIGIGAPPNVNPGFGRAVKCTPEVDVILGEGQHTVHCETTDGLWPNQSCDFTVHVQAGYPFVVTNVQDYVNLRLTATNCPLIDNPLAPCTGVGQGVFDVRNTGLGVAHDVVVTIPYPPEADRNNQLIRTGVDTACTRDGLVPTSPLVCHLGDLAPGGSITVQLSYAQKDFQTFFSPVQVSVATTDPELAAHDNVIQFHAGSFVGTGGFVTIPCPEWCQEEKRQRALEQCRKSNNRPGLAVLLGDPCDDPPDWFRYIIAGAFAVGTIVTGVGAVALGSFGAIDSVVFTAVEAGGFIL